MFKSKKKHTQLKKSIRPTDWFEMKPADPLFKAASKGSTILLKILIRETGNLGFIKNRRDERGNTVVHWASATGSLDYIKTLAGSNFGTRETFKGLFETKNKDGKTPLQIAEEKHHQGVKYFISKHIPKNKKIIDDTLRGQVDGSSIPDKSEIKGSHIKLKSSSTRGVSLEAPSSHRKKRNSSTLSSVDHFLKNGLHEFIKNNQIKMIDTIGFEKYNIKVLESLEETTGTSIFHFCVQNDIVKKVTEMIAVGVNPSHKARDGKTALDFTEDLKLQGELKKAILNYSLFNTRGTVSKHGYFKVNTTKPESKKAPTPILNHTPTADSRMKNRV